MKQITTLYFIAILLYAFKMYRYLVLLHKIYKIILNLMGYKCIFSVHKVSNITIKLKHNFSIKKEHTVIHNIPC